MFVEVCSGHQLELSNNSGVQEKTLFAPSCSPSLLNIISAFAPAAHVRAAESRTPRHGRRLSQKWKFTNNLSRKRASA